MGGQSLVAPLDNASVQGSTVDLVITSRGTDSTQVERAINAEIDYAKDWLGRQAVMANGYVAAWTRMARETLMGTAGQRQSTLATTANVMKSLNIPLHKAKAAVPVVKKPKRLTTARTSGATTSRRDSEYRLEEAIYQDIVETIRALGLAAERLPTTNQKLTEEDLRNVILFVLNANYEGQVVGEAFSGAAKTDILLIWKSRAAFVG